MKILWVKTDFLHPTTRGGQIRTLEMLRHLHRRHEIHYVAFDDANAEGVERSKEYASRCYPVPHRIISKRSPGFALQLAQGLFSRLPVACMRYLSQRMRELISQLTSKEQFDVKVCDFLFPSVNVDDMSSWILFQHNIETIIWERHVKAARTPLHRAYFRLQARKMFEWECFVCRRAAHVIAVSEADEQVMRQRFGVKHISWVPTGVDLDHFVRPEAAPPPLYDLVFVGSMDWMPNIDGVNWFFAEILPLIRAQKPDCRVAIVGRRPPASIVSQGSDPLITITGTVPDVRPYLWQSAVSIVPLRVGGGTRLKIFEAMAAGTPVVSTTVGADGLPLRHGETVRIADSPVNFAAECLDLLQHEEARKEMAARALELVRSSFSWAQVTRQFEQILENVAQAAQVS